MRSLLPLVLVALLAAVPLGGATVSVFTAKYEAALDGTIVASGFWDPVYATEDGRYDVGGAVFPTHGHDATATITVTDTLNGGIPVVVCQDVNTDFVCDTTTGSPDSWACLASGSGTFAALGPDTSTTPAKARPVTVFVTSPAFIVPECGNVQGQGTTGWIKLEYS